MCMCMYICIYLYSYIYNPEPEPESPNPEVRSPTRPRRVRLVITSLEETRPRYDFELLHRLQYR